MSQYKDIDHANKSFRTALEQYKIDKERIIAIKERYKHPNQVPQNSFNTIHEDVEWLCQIAKDGIDSKEENWYSHD